MVKNYVSGLRRSARAGTALLVGMALAVGGLLAATPAQAAGPSIVGYLDSVTYDGNYATMRGWTLDANNRSAAGNYYVALYYGSNFQYQSSNASGTTDITRNDVNAAYNTTGRHGFARTLYVPPTLSRYTLCALGGPAGGASTTNLNGSCKTISRV